jgi:hypothetical protein
MIEIPLKYKCMYDKAMSGKSRKAAMRCHCLMCVGWQPAEVTRCTAKSCPLYPYRLGAAPSEGGEPLSGRGPQRSESTQVA